MLVTITLHKIKYKDRIGEQFCIIPYIMFGMDWNPNGQEFKCLLQFQTSVIDQFDSLTVSTEINKNHMYLSAYYPMT